MVSSITDRAYGLSSNVAVKAPCLWLAVANCPLSGLTGVQDGAPNVGDRVLVISQTDPTTNGIYNANNGAWCRSGDFDGVNDCVQGTLVIVYYPNTQGFVYQLITPNPIIGTTPLQFQSYQNLNPAGLYPVAPWEAGLNVVATQYPYGHVYRYGAIGNGFADDSAAIYDASIGGNGVFIAPAGTYYCGTAAPLITFDYVDMMLQGDVLFTGTGYIRGVLTNETIPHASFQIGYNLVTLKERTPITIAGASYWIDPLLGSDTNTGTTSLAPVATITRALALIASVAGTAASLTMVCRSGRHEQPLGGTTMSGAHTLVSGGTVSWIANPGEKPVITPALYWFFQSSAKSANYNGVYAVANTSPAAFADLWDAETGLPIENATNLGPDFSLPRNQVAAVSLTGGASPYTISITLNADDATALGVMSVTELAGAQLRLHHSYTTSWHDNLSAAGAVLSANGYTNTAIYYNGWNSTGLTQGAPYLLRNVKGYLNGRNFAGYSNNVFLPNKGINFFTTDQTATQLLSIGAAANHTFTGISFAYQAGQLSTLTKCWVPSPFSQAGAIGLLVGGSGANTSAIQCRFEYGAYSGFVLGYAGSLAVWNKMRFLGLSGVNYYNAQALGCGGAVIKWNEFERCAHFGSAAGRAIHVGGINVTVYENKIRNCGTTGIHFDSGGNISTFPTGAGGAIQRNVVLEGGIIDGKPATLYAMNDAGGIYWFGGLMSAFALNVFGNVSGRLYSTSAGYNLYGDGGCNGVKVYGNLAWGGATRALMMEQNGGFNFNNSVRGNLLVGNVRVNSSSASGASDFSNNVVSEIRGNIVDATYVVATEPNQWGARIGAQASDFVELWQEDPGLPLLNAGVAGFQIDPFCWNFVRQASTVSGAGGSTNSSAGLVVITGNYTVQDTDEFIIANSGSSITLTFPPGWGNGGREIFVKSLLGAVVSSSGNIAPLSSDALGTAILSGAAKFATLKGDGLGNWYTSASN
jgi:hypothetical protein